MVESGWDDDNQKQFEHDLKEVKVIIDKEITEVKEIFINFLEER